MLLLHAAQLRQHLVCGARAVKVKNYEITHRGLQFLPSAASRWAEHCNNHEFRRYPYLGKGRANTVCELYFAEDHCVGLRWCGPQRVLRATDVARRNGP